MSERSQKNLCAAIGGIGFIFAIGIVGGIEQGAPLGNFVYAFASIIGSFVAFCKGGYIE